MSLIELRNVSLAYGAQPLLDEVNLTLQRGERLCLVGRNGAGKSSLLRILSGAATADDGEVIRADGLRTAGLAQEVPEDLRGSVYHVVAEGLGGAAATVERYHALAQQVASGDHDALAALEQCQHELEAQGGWSLQQRVDSVITKLQLSADADTETLSGGWRRRLLLAQALVAAPDVLLMDEPTNHLDVEAIEWLEQWLLDWSGTLVFISHDRAFVQRLAGRIVELDRGRLYDFPGDYATYLQRKQALLDAEGAQAAEFDKKLAREETWIRQGIKARRTRNEGRVRALKQLRAQRAERRERQGTARLRVEQGERSGRQVLKAEHVQIAFGAQLIARDFSTVIQRGDKVGLIGPNGVGKTTLLKVLLGLRPPERGRVELGTRLQIAYFDQQRAQLDATSTVADSVAQGSEHVELQGGRRHVLSYLQDFLFSPARARQPVSALSGGERNRLLLARLFAQPANVLVLDEPTNDLDLETLELLEALLVSFDGTVLLVSHDRVFLDHVVTSTLVFEGEGRIQEYVGGYQDWLRQRAADTARPSPAPQARKGAARAKPAAKLSYKDQRELDTLPAEIESLEQQLAEVQARMSAPEFYQNTGEKIARSQQAMEALEQRLQQAYERWETLEQTRDDLTEN